MNSKLRIPLCWKVGYGLLAIVYLLLIPGHLTIAGALLLLLLMGAYSAASDGVLTAMAAAVVPAPVAGTGLSMLATTTNVAKLGASVIFGALWAQFGMHAATLTYLVALAGAIGIAMMLLARRT